MHSLKMTGPQSVSICDAFYKEFFFFFLKWWGLEVCRWFPPDISWDRNCSFGYSIRTFGFHFRLLSCTCPDGWSQGTQPNSCTDHLVRHRLLPWFVEVSASPPQEVESPTAVVLKPAIPTPLGLNRGHLRPSAKQILTLQFVTVAN